MKRQRSEAVRSFLSFPFPRVATSCSVLPCLSGPASSSHSACFYTAGAGSSRSLLRPPADDACYPLIDTRVPLTLPRALHRQETVDSSMSPRPDTTPFRLFITETWIHTFALVCRLIRLCSACVSSPRGSSFAGPPLQTTTFRSPGTLNYVTYGG